MVLIYTKKILTCHHNKERGDLLGKWEGENSEYSQPAILMNY